MSIVLSNPLGPKWTASRHGKADGEAGIVASHGVGLTVVEVAALPDQAEALRTALSAAFGMDLGDGSPAHSAETAVCTGPGQYLLTGHDVQTVKAAVGDLAMVADQSSGRVQVSIDGPAVADLLAKACPINLADWPVGAAQASHFLHIACAYYRRSETGFDLYFGRSFAQSAAQWLLDAGAEFGVEIR
jgi:sarcosine oxidase subunit gamma